MSYQKDEIQKMIADVQVDFNERSSKILQKLDSAVKLLKESGIPVELELVPTSSQKSFAMARGDRKKYSIYNTHSGYISIDNSVNFLLAICKHNHDEVGNEIDNPKYQLFISRDHVEKGFFSNHHDMGSIRSLEIDLLSTDGLKEFQDIIIERYIDIIELKQLNQLGNLYKTNGKENKNKVIDLRNKLTN